LDAELIHAAHRVGERLHRGSERAWYWDRNRHSSYHRDPATECIIAIRQWNRIWRQSREAKLLSCVRW
jgi:hypothetical protein